MLSKSTTPTTKTKSELTEAALRANPLITVVDKKQKTILDTHLFEGSQDIVFLIAPKTPLSSHDEMAKLCASLIPSSIYEVKKPEWVSAGMVETISVARIHVTEPIGTLRASALLETKDPVLRADIAAKYPQNGLGQFVIEEKAIEQQRITWIYLYPDLESAKADSGLKIRR
jgi:hypothetical protein